MRERVTIAVLICGLAATAAAQSGARITLPPNARQSAKFTFANSCATAQTFQVTAEPTAKWLHFEPSSIGVEPASSFSIAVTVNSAGNLSTGDYRSNLKVFCASCAVGQYPCLQDAKQFFLDLTVAPAHPIGQFEIVAAPVVTSPNRAAPSRPMPVIPIDDPPKPASSHYVAIIGGAILLLGIAGGVGAMWAMSAGRPSKTGTGQFTAESERHQIRR